MLTSVIQLYARENISNFHAQCRIGRRRFCNQCGFTRVAGFPPAQPPTWKARVFSQGFPSPEPMAGGPIPLIGISTSNWDPLPAFYPTTLNCIKNKQTNKHKQTN